MIDVIRTIAMLCMINTGSENLVYAQSLQIDCQQALVKCVLEPDKTLAHCVADRVHK